MSIRVMQTIWQHSQAEGTALLLLLAIGDCANDEGVAWPAVDTLAKKARCCGRRVQQICQQLIGFGELVIDVEAGPRRCNRYRVVLTGDPQKNAAPGRSGLHPETGFGVQPASPSAAVEGEAGFTLPDPEGRSGLHPEAGCTPKPASREGEAGCTLRVKPIAPDPSGNRQDPTEARRHPEGEAGFGVKPVAPPKPASPPEEGTGGALVPSDDEVLAFASTFVDLARGITSIPEDYALRWLAFRTTPKAGPFPPRWKDDLKRRFVADWVTTSRGETPLGGKVGRSGRLERENRQVQAERLRARLDQTGLSPDERSALRAQIQSLEAPEGGAA